MVFLQPLVDFVTLILRILLSYVIVVFRLIFKRPKKCVEREIVLVTGAGHGIGREVALTFGRLGAKLVLLDINKENNEATAEEICLTGGEATAYVCDVTDPDNVRSVGERIHKDVGDVSILVNNAGILHGGALLDLTDNDIRRTFNVNTVAQFWTVREFLPAMLEKNSGHVVNMASMAATTGVGYLVDYASSKWAVVGFTESLKDELSRLDRSGVKTSIVCPHFVDTGMTKFPIFTRFDRFLTAKETAEALVDGVLREEEMIFIPPSMGFMVTISRFLTRRGQDLVKSYMETGIHPQYQNTTDPARKTD